MSTPGQFWWTQSGQEQADAVWSHVETLQKRQTLRVLRDQVNERIYSSNVAGGIGRAVDTATALRSIGFTSADLNFCRQIVDALVARIGNDQPAIRVAADGAEWSQRRQAKLIDKLIAGEMEGLDTAAEAPLCLRDALITRAGVRKIVAHNGDIVADRIPCEEIVLDEREARYGKPRQMQHVKQVAREVLCRDYSEHERAVEQAPPAGKRDGELDLEYSGDSTMVDVIEAWHLPSGKDASDGKHVIAIKGQTLHQGPWKRPRFPFSFIRWSPPRRGFWGCSLVDELAALQFKVNEIARDLMQNIYFTSATKVLVRRGANIAKKHLAGKAPHTIEVDTPSDAIWQAPDGFSPAQFQFLQWLIQQMYEVSGVSQLMAQSKNPLGAGASGAALDSFYDIESERFSQLELSYARFHRDQGQLIVDAQQDLAESEKKPREVRWIKRSVVQKIEWPVDMEADKYELRLEAAGYMPKTRAGKLKAIEELTATGMLDPQWAASLMDFPDLEQANLIRNAPIEYALWAIEQCLDCELDEEGEVELEDSAPMPAPDPHANLDLCISVGKAVLLHQTTEGSRETKVPEGVLARVRNWIELCDAEVAKAAPAQPAMPPGMPAPGMDPMMGGAPPMGPPGMAPPGPPMDPMAGGMPPMPMGAA